GQRQPNSRPTARADPPATASLPDVHERRARLPDPVDPRARPAARLHPRGPCRRGRPAGARAHPGARPAIPRPRRTGTGPHASRNPHGENAPMTEDTRSAANAAALPLAGLKVLDLSRAL